MTVASTTNRITYTGNGSVSSYAYTFRVFDEDHLLVTVKSTDGVETTLALTTDYTVTGVTDLTGGNVVLVNNSQPWLTSGNLLTDYTLTIRRVVPLKQETDIRNQGDFFPESHEDEFDKLVMADQQQQDEIDRSVKLPESIAGSTFDTSLPPDINDPDSAGKAIVVNADADGFELAEESSAGVDALFMRDVVYISYADSPFAITSDHRGKLISVDTSGGDVAISLPAISGLDLTEAFAVIVRKQTSDINFITVTPNGLETLDKVAAAKKVNAQGDAILVVPDKDQSPDDWQSCYLREFNYAIAGSAASPSLSFNVDKDTGFYRAGSNQIGIASGGRMIAYMEDNLGPGFVFNPDAVNLASYVYQNLNTAVLVVSGGVGSGSGCVVKMYGGAHATKANRMEIFQNSTLYASITSAGVILEHQLTIKDVSSPSTPASGYKSIYPKSDGKWYQRNSSNVETELGSSSSGINYIANSSAEGGTTGWTLYDDAAAAPVDGTGGSLTTTLTATSSSPLRGTQSFLLTTTAANLIGEGVAYDFTIDSADLAKVLNISFDYAIASGTYATGDYTVYIIQDPSGTPVVIQPAPYQIQNLTVGLPGKFSATFQTSSTITTYRLVIHRAVSTSSAVTFKFDNMVVGPQLQLLGTPSSDWTEYTSVITSSGSAPSKGGTTTDKARWRRVGDSMEINFNYRQTSAGSAGTGTYFFSLPVGYAVDTNKISTAGVAIAVLGACGTGSLNGSTISPAVGTVLLNDSTTVYLKFANNNQAGNWAQNTQPLSDSSVEVSMEFTVPILGWGSTVAMSNDTDTRVVAASYTGCSGTLTSGVEASTTFTTKAVDTHSGYSGSVYTIPVAGIYEVYACVRINGSNSDGDNATLRIYKTGGAVATNTEYVSSNVEATVVVSAIVSCVAGDTIEIKHTQTGMGSPSFQTAQLSIKRLSGPATIASTETVKASYYGSTNQTIADSVNVLIDFDTRVYDSHGAVTTGASWKFTAPISGTYSLKTLIRTGSGGWNAGEGYTLFIFKGGAGLRYLGNYTASGSWTGAVLANGATDVRLLAGEYIDIRAYQNSGASIATSGGVDSVYVDIIRTGNY